MTGWDGSGAAPGGRVQSQDFICLIIDFTEML
jgi:hypothetical protein